MKYSCVDYVEQYDRNNQERDEWKKKRSDRKKGIICQDTSMAQLTIKTTLGWIPYQEEIQWETAEQINPKYIRSSQPKINHLTSFKYEGNLEEKMPHTELT